MDIHLVHVMWEGEGLMQDEGGDADDANTDPDDGDGHLGTLLSPGHGCGCGSENILIKLVILE